MDLTKNLRQRCHVNTNEDGDSFVGVKADTDDAVIYFPLGYQLPENDDDLRVDINNLGTMINYTNSFYSTVEDDVEFSIINNFLKLFQEGKIHREFRPVSWCPCCKSARTHEKIKLVKRDFKTYKNIKRNYINDLFLDLMQERLIKTLLCNKIIYKRKSGIYEDYKYYGLLE